MFCCGKRWRGNAFLQLFIYLHVVRWNKHVYYLYSSVYRLRSTLFLYFQAYKYMLASQTHTHGNSRALPACEFLGHKFRKRFSFSAAMKRSAEEISLPIDEPETRRTLKHILLKSKWVLRNGHPYYHNNNNDLYIYIHTHICVYCWCEFTIINGCHRFSIYGFHRGV